MGAKIKWTGSLTYEVRDLSLKRDEVVELTDEQVALLPLGSYEMLQKIAEGNKEPGGNGEDDGIPTDGEPLTDAQFKYLKEHTIEQLRQEASTLGLEIPNFLTKKGDIFTFLVDNGLEVEA